MDLVGQLIDYLGGCVSRYADAEPSACLYSHALAGRLDQAHKAMARLRQIDPTFRVSDIRRLFPYRRPEDLARFEEGMRKAGLPE